jgi:hypothetical protein
MVHNKCPSLQQTAAKRREVTTILHKSIRH